MNTTANKVQKVIIREEGNPFYHRVGDRLRPGFTAQMDPTIPGPECHVFRAYYPDGTMMGIGEFEIEKVKVRVRNYLGKDVEIEYEVRPYA